MLGAEFFSQSSLIFRQYIFGIAIYKIRSNGFDESGRILTGL